MNIIPKPITDINRLICGIYLEDIEMGEIYMHCANCHYNYSFHPIHEWLSKHSPICPLCQLQWTDYQIYSNISN